MKNGGWGHRPEGPVDLKYAERRPEPVRKAISWPDIMRQMRNDALYSELTNACMKIGLPLDALRSIGAVWCRQHYAVAFPMWQWTDKPEIVGIRLRDNQGNKWAVRGSRNGLFYGPNITPQENAWITEGPTDTAALLSLGFWAVGRASCQPYCDQLKPFLRNHGVKTVVIMSDKDAPGIAGAKGIARSIGLPAKIVLPWNGSKDARSLVLAGKTHDDFVHKMNAQEFVIWK